MSNCRICNHTLDTFFSFGDMPIANHLLSDPNDIGEAFFDLSVGFCPACYMVQLIELPPQETMYHDQYAFISSLSSHMVRHFEQFAAMVENNWLRHSEDPFVVEVGSNDGILLKTFAEKNIRHLGVEPSRNVAEMAIANGIATEVAFFNEEVAANIAAKQGQADAVLGANVICHIPDLNDIARGVSALLKPKGVFVFEAPYLGNTLTNVAYDQIYDEHVYFMAVHSIKNAFLPHGLSLVDVMPQPVHGGSMRYVLAREGVYPISQRVEKFLNYETRQGMTALGAYTQFAKDVAHSKQTLMSLLQKLHAEGKRVVGYAATAKSSTVINYCGITPELLPCIYDITPEKIGKYSPGAHIPIKPYAQFADNLPDYALLFAWNHANEIMQKEQAYAAQGGQWIVHVPKVQILGSVPQPDVVVN